MVFDLGCVVAEIEHCRGQAMSPVEFVDADCRVQPVGMFGLDGFGHATKMPEADRRDASAYGEPSVDRMGETEHHTALQGFTER